MIRKRINNLSEGDILEMPVANPQQPGAVLLPHKQRLTPRIIKLLGQVHYRSLWVDAPGTGAVGNVIPKHFIQSYRDMLGAMQNVFAAVRSGGIGDGMFAELRNCVSVFVSCRIKERCVFVPVDDLHSEQHHLLSFGGNVCHLALLLGVFLRRELFDDGKAEAHLDEYTDLCMGALLHEIGKLGVSQELLQREPWDLTQRDATEINSYTTKGYRLLLGRLGSEISAIALRHHIYQNGGGFPLEISESLSLQKSQKVTDLFCSIVRISHAYCELAFRDDYLPLEALEELNCARLHQFDNPCINALSRVVPAFDIGSRVSLSSGHMGVVAEFYPDYPFRPSVLLYWDKDGGVLPVQQQVVLPLLDYPNVRLSRIGGRKIEHLVPEKQDGDWEDAK